MPRTRRSFSAAFKLRVVREVEAGKSLAHAAREHHLHPNLIRTWRKRYGERGAEAFEPPRPDPDQKIAELERLIGQLTVENAFLKNVLARLEATRNDS